ncbi:G-protein coupled receptor, partial [Globisporangium splendens]
MVFVFRNRDVPIIKRSQYELLELMLVGGVVVCIASVVYAGKPSRVLCGQRPVAISTGFTTIFIALFVTSLRVYRVFMKSAMKSVKVSLLVMAKFILVFFSVDVVTFVVWYATDFPTPTTTIEQAHEFHGEIDRVRCESSSIIFSTLLIFWKAILLFMGIYVSFLVCNVSSDFQESMWIFTSAMVVLFGSLVIMPLAYLVEMAAAASYVFLAFTLLFCTLLVMVFMFVPKLFRLHAVMSKRSSQTTASERCVSGKQPTGATRGESSDVDESTTATRLSSTK